MRVKITGPDEQCINLTKVKHFVFEHSALAG